MRLTNIFRGFIAPTKTKRSHVRRKKNILNVLKHYLSKVKQDKLSRGRNERGYVLLMSLEIKKQKIRNDW